jgi:hypothetical protein
MGLCWSKPTGETHVVYTPLAHTPHALRIISEASKETESITDMEPLHI